MGGSSVDFTFSYHYNGMSDFQELNIPTNTVIYEIGNLPPRKRIPLGSDVLSSHYVPEFRTFPQTNSLYDVQRDLYLGKKEFCCTHPTTFYWSGEFNDTYSFTRDPQHLYLRTCDPDCKKDNFSFCNNTHYNNCVLSKALSNYWCDNLTPICNNWLYDLHTQDYNLNQPVIDATDDNMFLWCEGNMDNKYCEPWILGIRNSTNQRANQLADQVLYNQQVGSIKDKLTCLYPPDYVINSQNLYAVPYECWWAPCSDANNKYLTQKNLLARQQCYSFNCNISVGQFNVPSETEINIICMNTVVESKDTILYNKTMEELNLQFPILNYFIFVFMVVVIVVILMFTR